jgi:hypothetical protein
VTGYDCCPPNPLDRIEEGSFAPRQQTAACGRDLSLDYRAAGDKTVHDHDYSDDEQDVDQSSTHMDDEESENPKDEKNHRDSPKHDGILARSE